MAIEKPINIWRPRSGLEFRSNHAYNFWLNSIVLIDQVGKIIMLEIMIYYMFICLLVLCKF
jgi:hypothetical protein